MLSASAQATPQTNKRKHLVSLFLLNAAISCSKDPEMGQPILIIRKCKKREDRVIVTSHVFKKKEHEEYKVHGGIAYFS